MSFLYTLTSCEPSNYPDIIKLCHPSRHPMEGLVVYIDQTYNGQPVNYLRTYTLTYLGEENDICNDWLPFLGANFENSCTPSADLFTFEDCSTGERQAFAFYDPYVQPFVMIRDGECRAWRYQGEDIQTPPLVVGAFTPYNSCAEALSSLGGESCSISERGLSYASRVSLPENIPPDRGFDECCYNNIVLADANDTSEYKNDYNGFYFKREIPNTTVEFTLVDVSNATDYTITDDTYGVYQDFGGTQSDLSFFIVEWRKVLNTLGAATYQIRQTVTIAGVAQDYYSNTFQLKQFSIDIADKTVRIDCIQDGTLVESGIDFSGTGFKTSLRMKGFFGRPQHNYEQDNITTRTYDSIQNTMSFNKEYTFQAMKLPICITEELMEFVLLGDRLFISDYNKNNHSYKYELLEVELTSNNDTDYFTLKREVNVNLTFTDRFKNKRKINC